MKSWINPKIKIRSSPIGGKGMFACRNIKKDEIVIIWGGNFVTKKKLQKINKKNKIIIQVDDNLYSIENRNQPDDDTYFMNHSCEPNVWMKDGVTFVAKKNIKKGEELKIDYSMFESKNYVSKWNCNCRSKICRKKITGKDYLIPELQKRYKNHFSPVINKRIQDK